jgi:hypothetical protein
MIAVPCPMIDTSKHEAGTRCLLTAVGKGEEHHYPLVYLMSWIAPFHQHQWGERWCTHGVSQEMLAPNSPLLVVD